MSMKTTLKARGWSGDGSRPGKEKGPVRKKTQVKKAGTKSRGSGTKSDEEKGREEPRTG